MTGEWVFRHKRGMVHPKNFGEQIGQIIKWWSLYAEDHHKEYESYIMEDYVLGSGWEMIGKGLLTLLNGGLGRLDAGTLWDQIITTMQKNGVDTKKFTG